MARDCGVSNSAVSFWFNGTTKTLRGKNLASVARYLGVEPSWLSGHAGDELIAAPAAEVEAGLYTGIAYLHLPASDAPGTAPKREEVLQRGPLAFGREVFKAHGLHPEALRLYEARGESMAPNIKSGDVVVVDTKSTTPGNDEVWVLLDEYTPGARIRRVLINERGGWVLRCDNADKALYEDERLDPGATSTCKLLGKVVWRSSWRI